MFENYNSIVAIILIGSIVGTLILYLYFKKDRYKRFLTSDETNKLLTDQERNVHIEDKIDKVIIQEGETVPIQKTRTKKIYSNYNKYMRISNASIKNYSGVPFNKLSNSDLQIILNRIAKLNKDRLLSPYSFYFKGTLKDLSKAMDIEKSGSTLSAYLNGKKISKVSKKKIESWLKNNIKNKQIFLS